MIEKNQKEAEVTVRKTKSGKYFDLSKRSLVKKGKKRLTKKQLMDLFRKLRLRFTLTPKCNLWCIFCSNEGSSCTTKSQNYVKGELRENLRENRNPFWMPLSKIKKIVKEQPEKIFGLSLAILNEYLKHNNKL